MQTQLDRKKKRENIDISNIDVTTILIRFTHFLSDTIASWLVVSAKWSLNTCIFLLVLHLIESRNVLRFVCMKQV